MLCDLCKPITIKCLRDNEYEHHPNLASLKISAEETKCGFCNLLWQCLVESVDPRNIAAHLQGQLNEGETLTDFKIRLQGVILDMGQPNPNALEPSMIWVYSGASGAFGIRGTQVYSSLEVYAPLGEINAVEVTGHDLISF